MLSLAAAPDADAIAAAIDAVAERLRSANRRVASRTSIGHSGLEVLPLPAREAVVRLLCPRSDRWSQERNELRALPFVSLELLAALKELRLPVGEFRSSSIGEAVRQAHALRRAWDLGSLSLKLTFTEFSDLSRWLAVRRCTRSTSRNATA